MANAVKIYRFDLYKKLISASLKNDSTILDIGCHDAELGKYLYTEKKYKKYVGVDLNLSVLNSSKISHLQVMQVDLENGQLPFRNATFDLVLIMEVLEHVRSPIKLVQETMRVLRDDGKVLISLPNEYNILTRLRIMINGSIDEHALKDVDKHLHFPTLRQSIQFIKDHFTVIKMQYWSDNGGRLNCILKLLPDSFYTYLANICPPLFSRGIILFCIKKTQRADKIGNRL